MSDVKTNSIEKDRLERFTDTAESVAAQIVTRSSKPSNSDNKFVWTDSDLSVNKEADE